MNKASCRGDNTSVKSQVTADGQRQQLALYHVSANTVKSKTVSKDGAIMCTRARARTPCSLRTVVCSKLHEQTETYTCGLNIDTRTP